MERAKGPLNFLVLLKFLQDRGGIILISIKKEIYFIHEEFLVNILIVTDFLIPGMSGETIKMVSHLKGV